MIHRRSFVTGILAALLTHKAVPQKAAVTPEGKVKVCPPNVSTVTCPQGHQTCRKIDAAIVVGNGDTNYPNWAQVPNSKLLMCETCSVLFAEMS